MADLEFENGNPKRARFLALAEKRTRKALKALDLVARVLNRSTYEYEDEEADTILSALEEQLARVDEARMPKDLSKPYERFSL